MGGESTPSTSQLRLTLALWVFFFSFLLVWRVCACGLCRCFRSSCVVCVRAWYVCVCCGGGLVSGAFANAGQVCSATSRVLVHQDLAPAFCRRLVAAATSKLVVGDPWGPGTTLGPLVSAQQLAKVTKMVAAAHADPRCEALLPAAKGLGAWRGQRDPGGYFAAPQIFLCTPSSSRSSNSGSSAAAASGEGDEDDSGPWPAVWREEVFGPVLCVATFQDLHEGIELANASPFGLAHAIFSASAQTRAAAARRLRAGVVWENCSQAVYPATPFGGCKQSGFGREHGALGLAEYVHHKTVVTAADGHVWRWFG